MADNDREQRSPEFDEEQATDLPERENMSLVNANLAAPINAALAANVLSDGATAGAGAHQTAPIGQDMLGGGSGTPATPATPTTPTTGAPTTSNNPLGI